MMSATKPRDSNSSRTLLFNWGCNPPVAVEYCLRRSRRAGLALTADSMVWVKLEVEVV